MFVVFRPLFTSFQSPSGAHSVAATVGSVVVAVDVVAIVAWRGGGLEFLPGQALATCPKDPLDQQYGLRPSTATNIHLSLHINIFRISPKACRVNVTCNTMSPVAIPALLMMEDTSSTRPYFEKKDHIRSSLIYPGTPCTVGWACNLSGVLMLLLLTHFRLLFRS